MPILTWWCERCKERFETFDPRYTDGPKECPRCGAEAEQIPSAPAKFQWGKSGGWHK